MGRADRHEHAGGALTLYRIAQPANPHLDSGQVLEQSREFGRIRVAVVAGVENLWLEIQELICPRSISVPKCIIQNQLKAYP